MGKATKVRANRAVPQRDILGDTATASGLPAAQRDNDRLALADAPVVEGYSRTASQTVRRLTRVELLARAGVLEPHEAQACEWYAGITALAWDTTGCTANYEGGRGGGGSAHAPDRLMAKLDIVADAREDYLDARRMLGSAMGDAFEAIVCRNEALGPTAAAAFPDLKRSQAGERLRTTVRFCANKLHERFGKLMGWDSAPGVVAARTPAAAPVAATAAQALFDQLLLTVAEANRNGSVDELWIAKACHEAIVKEIGKDVDEIDGLPVVVRDDWRWGYVAIRGALSPL